MGLVDYWRNINVQNVKFIVTFQFHNVSCDYQMKTAHWRALTVVDQCLWTSVLKQRLLRLVADIDHIPLYLTGAQAYSDSCQSISLHCAKFTECLEACTPAWMLLASCAIWPSIISKQHLLCAIQQRCSILSPMETVHTVGEETEQMS